MTSETTRGGEDLPIIGPWISRLGKIDDIWATPCATTPEIWVLAAWQTLPRMLAGLIKPFPIAETWHSLTERSHHKSKNRNRTGYRRGMGFFRAIELLKPVLPVGEGLGWAVFEVTGDLALRALWVFLVIDMVTEFGVNWSSLVYEYSGCDITGVPFAQGTMQEGIENGTESRTDYVLGGWAPTGHHIFTIDNASIDSPRFYSPTVAFSLETGPNPFGFPDATWSARLVETISGYVSPTIASKPTEDNKNYASYVARGQLLGILPQHWEVHIDKSEGVMWCTGGKFTAYGIKSNEKGLFPDP